MHRAWGGLTSLAGTQLTRDGQEVARSTRQFITEGIFVGKTKFVLHIEPECSTLDVGLIILTFLIVDQKRHAKENGPPGWSDVGEEDPGDGEGEGEAAQAEHAMEG